MIMFKRKDNEYQKVCLFCENATILKGDENVLCKHKGIVSEDYVCRKYIYDPLKRQPSIKPKMPTLSKEDLL